MKIKDLLSKAKTELNEEEKQQVVSSLKEKLVEMKITQSN